MKIATMKQSIRIIGGRYRGKILHFPTSESLRPTPNRVRETLFNWLMHDIRGAHCLDAFAGSGALGFEAFSRGATTVVMIERALEAYAALQQQTKSFATSSLIALNDDAYDYLQNSTMVFDIVFLDPPFTHSDLSCCLHALTTRPILKTNGLLYLEAPQAVELDQNHWLLIKAKRAGSVFYSLYKKIASP